MGNLSKKNYCPMLFFVVLCCLIHQTISEMKMKTFVSILHFARLFVTLASPKLLPLGNAQINLAFPSLIRNFGCAEITFARK